MSISIFETHLQPLIASNSLDYQHSGSLQAKLNLFASSATSVHTLACTFVFLAKSSIAFLFQHLFGISHSLMFQFRLFQTYRFIPFKLSYVIKILISFFFVMTTIFKPHPSSLSASHLGNMIRKPECSLPCH